MTTHINRRTALAGAAAGTLIPVAGLANASSSTHSAAEPDPFVSAFCRFVDAEQTFIRAADLEREDEDDQWINDLGAASDEARLAMAQTVPTTQLGLMLAIHALLPVFGHPKYDKPVNLFDFDCMEVHETWTNGSGEALLRSLFAGAERIWIGNEEAA